jgi:hypothetical protein
MCSLFMAGVLHVIVDCILGFSENAGILDKTDPFVELALSSLKLKTRTKDNAGGTGNKFSKVRYIGTRHSKYTRALSFENLSVSNLQRVPHFL